MPQTFAYDLVSFLRVLHRRRGMIIKGTIGVTLLVAIATLIWPQTWRADARVLVSSPIYKENLRLIPKPFDVLTYQGLMTSDPIFMQVIDTLKWFHASIRALKNNPDYLKRIEDRLGAKAQGMTALDKIQNTTQSILAEFLISPEEKKNPQWKTRLSMLGNLNDEELALIDALDEGDLDDLTVFNLRKMLTTTVVKVRETNMEVEYSRVIAVSAEFDTAAGARMVANIWLDLFLAHAEELARSMVEREIQMARNRASAIEIKLVTAETKLADYERDANLGQARAELASKLVQLTGMTPNRRIADQVEATFDLENQNQPFMNERREKTDLLSFTISPQYPDALLPTHLRVEGECNVAEALLKAQTASGVALQDLQNEKAKMTARLETIQNQIGGVTQEIAALWKTIREHETRIDQMRREVTQYQSALSSLQILLDESALLENQGKDARYADVSAERAIKPDKRIFPKRTTMTAIGLALSFFLWCCMAFFLDIWQEVVKPDDPTRNKIAASGTNCES